MAVSVAHPQAAQPTRATSQFEAIVGSEEDRFKAAASKIENSAHRANEEQDRQAREVGEQISQLVISSRSVRDQIAAGSIAPGEALEVTGSLAFATCRGSGRLAVARRPCTG